MKVHFTGRTPHLGEPDPRRDRSAGVPPIPAHILDRHHARQLRPGEAALAPGQSTPGGTIYRYDRLLLSGRLLNNAERLAELDTALAVYGIRVRRPDAGVRSRRARLTIGDRATPATLDAWDTMQNLRAAIHSGRCHDELAKRVRLEHLLVGSAFSGVGMLGQKEDYYPGTGGPFNGPSANTAYPGRVPVNLIVPMPSRRPAHALPGGRRPVVAVLDTGVSKRHPAFEVSDYQERLDTFVTVDHELQDELAATADPETPVLAKPWDQAYVSHSLVHEIASHFGHGTFITGIIRQIAPDAQVRSIRVMHNDGMVYENELIGALNHLADEVERARDGDDSAQPVDIIVLSMGYVDEEPGGVPEGSQLSAIKRLTSLGVTVVAAAGNYATDRPFYPAAYSATSMENEAAPMISVGALNPNGSVAMFSNAGPWLTCYASGASIISTYPTGPDGSASPLVQVDDEYLPRESLDPDDFKAGFAIWSGTSFAAPVVAAKLAAAMYSDDESQEFSVNDIRAAVNRSRSALKAIGG
ncbi:peptidase S8 [Actinorhabdospora filicis]|uniref:Peptidase S8 n=1 Tax=Actinorhabdospora filicis TaxID=1785913 RepID=A0A9W6SHI3_9ACTN|nr:S8 family serine peptidase [Actinorhabdospora filicis]GLZ76093.1 peptidase S8 [Actinorhabdospora filicis]